MIGPGEKPGFMRLADNRRGVQPRNEAGWAAAPRPGIAGAGLLQLAHTVGKFNLLARFADAFGAPVDEAVAEVRCAKRAVTPDD
jgi:hypothetical protein